MKKPSVSLMSDDVDTLDERHVPCASHYECRKSSQKS